MAFERKFSRNVADAGTLNRRITLLSRHVMQESVFGTDTITWPPFAEVWADVEDILPSRAERISPGIDLASKPCLIRMRFLAGVTADMRIRYGTRILQIIGGPAVMRDDAGRVVGLELMAVEVSTQGDGI